MTLRSRCGRKNNGPKCVHTLIHKAYEYVVLDYMAMGIQVANEIKVANQLTLKYRDYLSWPSGIPGVCTSGRRGQKRLRERDGTTEAGSE